MRLIYLLGKRWFTPLMSVLFLLCSTSLYAQKTWGGSGGFRIGYMNIDASGFQQFLPEGAPSLSNNYLLIGGEGYGIFNRFLLGGSGFGLTGDQVTFTQGGEPEIRATLGGGAGFFNLGYTIISNTNWMVFPMLGIGGGGVGMNLSPRQDISRDQIQKGDFVETNVGQGSFMLDFMVGADFFPFQGGQGLKVGVRAGYIWAVNRGDWSYSGGAVTGANNDGISGFHFSLTIGGGGGG